MLHSGRRRMPLVYCCRQMSEASGPPLCMFSRRSSERGEGKATYKTKTGQSTFPRKDGLSSLCTLCLFHFIPITYQHAPIRRIIWKCSNVPINEIQKKVFRSPQSPSFCVEAIEWGTASSRTSRCATCRQHSEVGGHRYSTVCRCWRRLLETGYSFSSSERG